MSIDAQRWVFECSVARGTDRLVLLALAWHHHPDTGLCAPGLRTLARETGCHPETVAHAIDRLVKAGELCVVRSRGGRGRTNRYVLTLSTTRGTEPRDSLSTTRGKRADNARTRAAHLRADQGRADSYLTENGARTRVSDGRAERFYPGSGWVDVGDVIDTGEL